MKEQIQLALSPNDLELVKESLSATINNLVERFAHTSNKGDVQQQRHAIRLANKVRQVKRVLTIIDHKDNPPDTSRGPVIDINSSKKLRREP